MTLKEEFEQYAKQEVWEKKNYNAEECEVIAETFAIGFASWCCARAIGVNYFKLNEEELEQFKKEKGL